MTDSLSKLDSSDEFPIHLSRDSNMVPLLQIRLTLEASNSPDSTKVGYHRVYAYAVAVPRVAGISRKSFVSLTVLKELFSVSGGANWSYSG